MIKKHILRLLIVLLGSIIISSICGICTISDEIPKMLFDVLGILFPLALAVVTSIDLLRVKNSRYRKEFRKSLRSVRNSIITQFTFSVLAIIAVYLFKAEECFSVWIINIQPNITATFVIGFSIVHIIYTFVKVQKLKEDIEDKLESEGV